jgi:hypothetical protein
MASFVPVQSYTPSPPPLLQLPHAGISWVDSRLLDCLSLSWSFLCIRDFARAIRCSRAWLTVGRRRTAWPPISIATITRSIELEAYDTSAARRASVNVNRTAGRRGLQRACHSPIWKNLEDVHIWTGKTFHRQQPDQVRPKQYDDDALRAVLRLAQLKSLNLGLTRPSCQAVLECFTRVSSTLECLISNVPTVAVVTNLHILSHLRVLVIKIHRPDWAPVHTIGSGPASQLANALPALLQLQSLHYDDRNVDALLWAAPVQIHSDEERASPLKEARAVLVAVRNLSVDHKLSKLSIRWRNSVVTHQSDALDLSPLEGARLDTVQLDIFVPTAANLLALVTLPALIQLEWLCSMNLLAEVIQYSAPPKHQASALRCLRLRHHRSEQSSLYPLVGPGVLAYWVAVAPALEQLEVSGVRMKARDWTLLAQWSQLRELRIYAPLELCLDQISAFQRWSSWQVIHLNPARRGGPSCGCRWRLTRRMQRSWNSDGFNSHNLRLIQTSPPDSDEHGHVSSEYMLRLKPVQMTDDDTPSTACPEWVPVEDAPE